MKIKLAVLIALMAAAFASAGEPIKAKVESLKWMAGSWHCPKWGGTFEEHWVAPNGGSMMGVGRLVAGGKTNFMEFLSLEPEGEGVTMWIMLESPSKSPKKSYAFRLTALKPTEAVFEGPADDFPSKITYRKKPDGTISCRIEGMQKGKFASDDFPFKRIKK